MEKGQFSIDADRLVNLYATELQKSLPLADPNEVAAALKKACPELPADQFFPTGVPERIRILHREARIARERYLNEIANILLNNAPQRGKHGPMFDETGKKRK